MLSNYSKYFMPMHMRDNVSFTFDDKCIWVLHPPGASGDLIASIIDKHYIATGCQYYGINENGQVIFYPADNKLYTRGISDFDDSFLYKVGDTLGERNLTYGLLDNIIFTSHDLNHKKILERFKQAKIINIYNETQEETDLINRMSTLKNNVESREIIRLPIDNKRILNIDFKDIFIEEKFEEMYSKMIEFLNIPCKLIRFDFIKFYISKQHPEIQKELTAFGKK